MGGPFGRALRRRATTADHRVIHQVASWCLQYPDDELIARVGLLRGALDEQPASAAVDALHRFVAHLTEADPAELRRDYVNEFDLSRHQTLYLTYWSHGDTRRRGDALTAIKRRYREAGFLVDTHGELTDYLPMVLEFAARVDPSSGLELLVEHRASVELIRLALREKESPYADVLFAVCATLPGDSPQDKASALAIRGAAARSDVVEQVGLDSGDPRLMPLFTKSEFAGSAPKPVDGADRRREEVARR